MMMHNDNVPHANSFTSASRKKMKNRRRRIDSLAQSKPVPIGFQEDRRSVYWENTFVKEWNGEDVGTQFAVSVRLSDLIMPKQLHKEYSGDRPSPMWIVNDAAKNAEASERVCTLASAKEHHKDFEPEKSVYTVVSDAAKSTEPSQRIETLARPKVYKDLPIKANSAWDWGEWESDIPNAALYAEPSDRVTLLARPKTVHQVYKECRPVVWQVSNTAKKALPSLRVQQLARPKSRSQYKEDYNPSWWKVSAAAKTAHAVPRLDELATPIPRKVRQKKAAKAT